MWDVNERLERIEVESDLGGDMWVSLTGAEGGRVDLPLRVLFGASDAARELLLGRAEDRVKDGHESPSRSVVELAAEVDEIRLPVLGPGWQR